MASITDLTYTDNMSGSRKPFLTDLRASLDSFEDYINDLKADIIQVTHDSWGTGYALDEDEAKQFTNTSLYDKLTVIDSYTGGDITIAATAAWTDVDATNASIVVTPEYLAGDFLVRCHFNVQIVTSNATNEADIRFRLTDGSENSTYIAKVRAVTGVTACTYEIPVCVTHEFDSWSVAAHTVKLQYYIVTTTATVIKILANSNATIYMQAEKI
jgi:hypothetical protein